MLPNCVALALCSLAALPIITSPALANNDEGRQDRLALCLSSEEFEKIEESRLKSCAKQTVEACYRLENNEDVDACFATNAKLLREFNNKVSFQLAARDAGKSGTVAEAQYLRETNQRTCIKDIPGVVLNACMLIMEFGFTGGLLYISKN